MRPRFTSIQPVASLYLHYYILLTRPYSFVRSITMDKWKDSELQKMKAGGNREARVFFESQSDWSDSMTLHEKYNTRAAALYRDKVLFCDHYHHSVRYILYLHIHTYTIYYIYIYILAVSDSALLGFRFFHIIYIH